VRARALRRRLCPVTRTARAQRQRKGRGQGGEGASRSARQLSCSLALRSPQAPIRQAADAAARRPAGLRGCDRAASERTSVGPARGCCPERAGPWQEAAQIRSCKHAQAVFRRKQAPEACQPGSSAGRARRSRAQARHARAQRALHNQAERKARMSARCRAACAPAKRRGAARATTAPSIRAARAGGRERTRRAQRTCLEPVPASRRATSRATAAPHSAASRLQPVRRSPAPPLRHSGPTGVTGGGPGKLHMSSTAACRRPARGRRPLARCVSRAHARMQQLAAPASVQHRDTAKVLRYAARLPQLARRRAAAKQLPHSNDVALARARHPPTIQARPAQRHAVQSQVKLTPP
jgi:hypothetical protein